MPSVLIIQEHMPAFRVRFYDILREKLAAEGVKLDLIYAPNQRNTFVTGEVGWAIRVPIRWFGSKLGWQPALRHCRGKDLVVVQQETKYLVNPLLQLWSGFGGPKIAYWGHGRNFQARNKHSRAERFKAWLSKRVDWWFAYNNLSAQAVIETGFPEERITSVMNAVDTLVLRQTQASTTTADLDALRQQLGITSSNVAVYTGGLYKSKRLAFLLETADRVKERIPDFHLIVIGAGPDAEIIEEAAKTRPWLHAVGSKSDKEKTPYWMISKLVLIPGLVGLVVVDSFAFGVPLVTTDYPFHSPEIDYLNSGKNGLIVRCGEDAEAYAAAVARLLEDEETRSRLAAVAKADGARYSLENMATNFADGVMQCLGR
jgi:glycosyltransferase involved in cell wall biosynthesis